MTTSLDFNRQRLGRFGNRRGSRRATRRERSLKLQIGIGILVVIAVAGLVVPWLSDTTPEQQQLGERLLGPSTSHLFGTDDLGRDVFLRCMAAARIDLPLALAGALIPAIIGTVLGLVSGFSGRWLDGVIMRIGDMIQAFPSYILLVIIAFAIGPGITSFLIAIAILSWVAYARLVRSQVQVIRELDYVQAARLSGVGRARLLFRHILPNSMPQVVVYFAADATLALIMLSGLSFLGLGIPEPTPEWGLMIDSGRLYMRSAWWLTTFPGIMIVLTAAGLALVSDALDDRSRV